MKSKKCDVREYEWSNGVARGVFLGRRRGDKFRLLAGSHIRAETTRSFETKPSARNLREYIVHLASKAGEDDSYLVTTEDVVCKSASEAATVVAGTPMSGYKAFGYPPGYRWF